MARVGILVLACAFSSAGHAQLQAKDLDHAVGELVRTLVNEGRLPGQKVYVGADDFFEEENELRPPLSKILRTMCLRALTDRQVAVVLVQAEAARVLHGRWRRESETHLHLTLFISDPPRGQEEPVATRSADALVPVEGLRRRDVEPTLRHWGDRVVRRLERDLPGSGKFRLHLSPLSVQDEALPEKFSAYLLGRWRPAFTGSDRFTLVGSVQSAEGVLRGDVFVAGEQVEVSLSVVDNQKNTVASDHVALESSLFPPGMVGGGDRKMPGAEAKLHRAAREDDVAGNDAAGQGSEEIERAKSFQDCDVCPEMVVIPAGGYEMGSPEWEEGRSKREGPLHPVTISAPLAVGVYEVTFEEWDACASVGGCYGYRPENSPWGSSRGRRPVINVSWKDARAYVEWLSRKTGREYRLLSESEWEYAARAGTASPFHYGWTVSTEQANYNGRFTYGYGRKGEYRGKTVPVGSFPPNEFGLHDMHGNVLEWVEDCWHGDYKEAPGDGSAWTSGGKCSERVLRGGSWNRNPSNLRSAYREGNSTGDRNSVSGFRVARTLTP